jgi:hypothetical protein
MGNNESENTCHFETYDEYKKGNSDKIYRFLVTDKDGYEKYLSSRERDISSGYKSVLWVLM